MNKLESTITSVAHELSRARRIAVLTGAGVSAESGVPTFRGAGGFWKDEEEVMRLATLQGFLADPKRVWEWYDMRRQMAKSVEPNPGHYALAQLEHITSARGGDFTLITQNIDGLHERAGSNNIIELHGNLWYARCLKNCTRDVYLLEQTPLPEYPPKCPQCDGILRPHVVWFGELLDPLVIESATRASLQAEVMLVVGTSAQVYPAAGLPYSARNAGALIVEINLEQTDLTPYAHLSIQGKSGEVLPQIVSVIDDMLKNQK